MGIVGKRDSGPFETAEAAAALQERLGEAGFDFDELIQDEEHGLFEFDVLCPDNGSPRRSYMLEMDSHKINPSPSASTPLSPSPGCTYPRQRHRSSWLCVI